MIENWTQVYWRAPYNQSIRCHSQRFIFSKIHWRLTESREQKCSVNNCNINTLSFFVADTETAKGTQQENESPVTVEERYVNPVTPQPEYENPELYEQLAN